MHTVESLRRKLDEADSLARDARRADASYRELGVESPSLPTPAIGALHLVRLPCCLSGGAADGAGEVLVGSPRAG